MYLVGSVEKLYFNIWLLHSRLIFYRRTKKKERNHLPIYSLAYKEFKWEKLRTRKNERKIYLNKCSDIQEIPTGEINLTFYLVFHRSIGMKDAQWSNKFSKFNYSIALDIKQIKDLQKYQNRCSIEREVSLQNVLAALLRKKACIGQHHDRWNSWNQSNIRKNYKREGEKEKKKN